VIDLLRERGATDIKVMGGGVIPESDVAELVRLGVVGLFTPGTRTSEIVDFVSGL
jgi:methylmalonyl-CoA mutase C-terminal domain/subunit